MHKIRKGRFKPTPLNSGKMIKCFPIDPRDFNSDHLNKTLQKFNAQETKHWQLMDFHNCLNPSVFEYTVVPFTEEADEIMCFLYSNTDNLDNRFLIKKITRVQNPYLMISYLINKDLLMETYGCNRVHHKYYLHGTFRENIHDICMYNFDLSLVQRHRHGWGIYFTSDIAKAQAFCDKNARLKEIVLAHVLESSVCVGRQDMTYPDYGTDTSISPTDKRIIVKYDDDMYCPAYKILFEQRF